MTLRLLLGTLTALAFHLMFGWTWSIAGGIIAGILGSKKGWLAGGIAVGLSWGLSVAHAFIVASAPTQRLLNLIGGLFGGIPSVLIPVITVLIGVLLGIAGGALGSSARPLVAPPFVKSMLHLFRWIVQFFEFMEGKLMRRPPRTTPSILQDAQKTAKALPPSEDWLDQGLEGNSE